MVATTPPAIVYLMPSDPQPCVELTVHSDGLHGTQTFVVNFCGHPWWWRGVIAPPTP